MDAERWNGSGAGCSAVVERVEDTLELVLILADRERETERRGRRRVDCCRRENDGHDRSAGRESQAQVRAAAKTARRGLRKSRASCERL